MKKRNTYSAGFKTKVVLELLQERETVQEIARKYELHPSQISTRKNQFLSNADVVFEKGTSWTEDDKEKNALFKKVGQLQLENDFLKKSIGEIAKKDRMGKIDKTHSLSVSRQCELLNVARSSFYFSPLEDGSYNEELMKLIDNQYMDTPFYGVPRMTNHLRGLGYEVNPNRIRRLYRKMDLYAIGRRPNTSKPHKGECHAIYPYLLRGLTVDHPNQVWAMDITYIPLGSSHMYLVGIIDVYSRYIVGWSLSNTMTTRWCRECLDEAIKNYGVPEIVNMDQGSQFSSPEFSAYFSSHEGLKFSMDCKGRAIDNIFIERFCRNIKYEKIYLEPSDNGLDLYSQIKEYMTYYNTERPHQGLEYKRPVEIYWEAA